MIIKHLQKTADFLRQQWGETPELGIVLGSGLGSFVNSIKVHKVIPYSDIPHFIAPTVAGHSGQFIFGSCEGVNLAILQGRLHYYEGHCMSEVVYPVRSLAMLGIQKLVLTNSAGGLNPNMSPGDFMVIDDHMNFMGDNPLKGPNLKDLGPRFPDMTEAYDKEYSETLFKLLEFHHGTAWRGIYCGVSGPTYETPAEVRHFQSIGGGAVGMSTVPETIAANHMGLRVCAMSCITNLASGLTNNKLSHEEVTQMASSAEQNFCKILIEFIRKIGKN